MATSPHPALLGCLALAVMGAGTEPEPRHAIEGPEIATVLARVKAEVGLFLTDSAVVDSKWPALVRDDLKVQPVCGTGQIDFNITSVKMDFTAESDRTGGADAGLKIPVLTSASGSLSPSAKIDYEGKSTETMSFLYYPPTLAEYRRSLPEPVATGQKPSEFEDIRPKAVIVPALDALRDGLVKATAQHPCFRNPPVAAPDDSLVFSVVLVADKSVAGGFNFYVVSLNTSAESKTTGSNTITVWFHPTNPGVPTAEVRGAKTAKLEDAAHKAGNRKQGVYASAVR